MDIVERLRSVTRLLVETDEFTYDQDDTLAEEAADEIERLRTGNRLHLELAEIKEAEIERLREENAQLLDRMSRIDGTYATMFSVVDALDAVNKIKNDPMTDVAKHQVIHGSMKTTAKDYMIAMAEDIEREIAARAALKEKKQ